MHQVILNTPKGMLSDHRNGNGLDNRRKNLRACNVQQNKANSRLPKNNTSGFKGVYWEKKLKKWGALIRVNGKAIYLGYNLDKAGAARRYNQAAYKYFSEFARLNIL